MAGVTAVAFSQMCKKYGADVVYSEMASVNALKYAPKKTLEMLRSDKQDKPYVIQLFGSNPKYFQNAVKVISDVRSAEKHNIENYYTPNGIDINFGCPVPKVAKQKAGAELSKDLKLSREVIKVTINSTNLPVSIKIRAQVGEVDALKFLDNISDLDVKTVMIHGRTLSQMHSGPVNFELIKKARNYFKGVVIANGGVKDKKSSDELLEKSKADGIAIGQATFGRPWIFDEIKNNKLRIINYKQAFDIALRHAELADKYKGNIGIIEMRKHLCWYAKGFINASELRREFVRIESISDIKKIIKKFSVV